MPQFEKHWFKKTNKMKNNMIICELCSKTIKSFGNHLVAKHNITVKEYVKMFPLSPTISETTARKISEWHKENPELDMQKFLKMKKLPMSIRRFKGGNKLQTVRLSFSDRGIPKTNEGKKHMSETKKKLFRDGILKSPNEGLRLSEDIKDKISEKRKQLFREGKLKNWNKGLAKELQPNYGKHFHCSEETKQKISKANKGLLAGEKNPFYGKHHTEKSKQKIREKSLGRILSEETKIKMSLSHRNRRNIL